MQKKQRKHWFFFFLSPFVCVNRSEYDQTIHLTFVYGENRSTTTDFIEALEPVDFNPRKGSPVEIVLNIVGIRPGHLIVAYQSDPPLDRTLMFNDFLRVNIGRTYRLDYCIEISGWFYFLAWSCSFYPQIFLNLKRKRFIDFIVKTKWKIDLFVSVSSV